MAVDAVVHRAKRDGVALVMVAGEVARDPFYRPNARA
jgi:hypothetical protein